MLFCYGWQKPLSGFADFQRGAFLLAGGQTCRRSGPERPGSAARDSTQSGAVTRTEQQPADRQKHQQARKAQGTPPPADRQKPPPEQRARATGQTGRETSQRHHQDGRPATRPGQQERHDKQQQTQQHHLNPRMKRGRETRQRAGHPPRLPIAGRGTGRQGPRLWAACRPARGLPWPCRPGQRPALPPAGGVPCAPPRAKRGEGGACAASARGGLNCGPPQGQGLQQQPAAGAPARLGGGTPSEGPRAATPGGECVGRAARHGLRRRRGRAGKAGRSAADRAGGADGPTAPTLWGPGRPGAPAPQPARGRSKARPAAGGLPWPCFAEGCPRATAGGQLDQDAPQARTWPPHFPGQTPQGAGRGGRRHRRRTGWAGCRPAGRRGGWDVARPQAGRGREPLSPGR